MSCIWKFWEEGVLFFCLLVCCLFNCSDGDLFLGCPPCSDICPMHTRLLRRDMFMPNKGGIVLLVVVGSAIVVWCLRDVLKSHRTHMTRHSGLEHGSRRSS